MTNKNLATIKVHWTGWKYCKSCGEPEGKLEAYWEGKQIEIWCRCPRNEHGEKLTDGLLTFRIENPPMMGVVKL